MEFKLVDTVELDYDFDFYNMKNRITYLNHGQYIIFEKSGNRICEVWAIYGSIILFGYFRDDSFGVKFTIDGHSSGSDVIKIYPIIQNEHNWFVEEYFR